MEKGAGQTLVNLVFVCLSYNILHGLITNPYNDDRSWGEGGVDSSLAVNSCCSSDQHSSIGVDAHPLAISQPFYCDFTVLASQHNR